jgi:DNA (cytosine-5)-methyltransferase 1
MLGGKSVNGLPVLFPYEDSVPYHLYWKVLNSKEHGVPQNRERVFIIGIRDDQDNNFRFPIEEHLTKRLNDVLEDDVADKYFLSENTLNTLINNQRFNKYKPIENFNTESSCITFNAGKVVNSNNYLKIGTWRTHKDGNGFREIHDGNCPTIPARAREDGSGQPVIKVKQINPSLESGGKQPYQQNRIYDSNGICPALNAGQVTWHGNIVTLPNEYRIRRLTPRECFRLQDFPDTFDFSVVSDSQAYKQAGNSITVRVLEKIIANLPL